MREIKFRAWDERKKTMWFRIEIQQYDDGSVGVYGEHSGRESDDFVLMQYTGLKDKNGVEIYEGDIVYLYRKNEPYVISFGTHETCEGDFYSSTAHGFYFKSVAQGTSIKECSMPFSDPIEVIGNIYQNPELLTT